LRSENATFSSIMMTVSSDTSGYDESTTLLPSYSAGWGLASWGGGSWGGRDVFLQTIRTYTPLNKSRGRWLNVKLSFSPSACHVCDRWHYGVLPTDVAEEPLMAALPKFRRIQREDIKDAPKWVDGLLYILNGFMEGIYLALSHSLYLWRQHRLVYEDVSNQGGRGGDQQHNAIFVAGHIHDQAARLPRGERA
jgi:hypothetical protein